MLVGIIGLGSIGIRHARNLKAMGHEVIGYDDSLYAMARANAEGLCTYCVTFLEGLWTKTDCVIICTPPDTHIGLMLEAFKHDCHVFVEKPLSDRHVTLLPAELQLTGNRWVNMVGCNWRFHAGAMKLKEWLDEGVIGETQWLRIWHRSYLPDWVQGRDYKASYTAKTGVILDVGSHLLDLAQWLCGDATTVIARHSPATSIDLECDGDALLILKQTRCASSSAISMSMVSPDKHNMGIRIDGTEGALGWDEAKCEVSLYAYGKLIRHFDYANVAQEVQAAMYLDAMAHFLDCVEKGQPTCNPVIEANKTLNLLLEAKELGRPVAAS